MAHGLSPPRRDAAARRRRLALGALAIAVTVLHLGAGRWIAERLVDLQREAALPMRLRAVFVRELLPSAPPLIATITPLPRGPRTVKALAPKAAASEPAARQEPPREVAAALETPPEVPAEGASAAAAPAQRVADAASSPAPAASVARIADAAEASASAAGAAASAAGTAFEWPASTRLSYTLTGYYRGPVEGSAQVEWVREGDHYQVHLDAVIGVRIAPLFTRRMSSDGVLGADGLAPRRYDEETRRAFATPRRAELRFERDAVWLADGRRREGWPGVQDSASQFVQLTWRFRMHPELLAVGKTIEVPLALPASVGRWIYDVVGAETIHAPFGAVEAFHLKPRRIAQAGGDMTAEIWFAPSLEYLPVRIRIHQDAETFVDMTIERPPLQADDPYSAGTERRSPR